MMRSSFASHGLHDVPPLRPSATWTVPMLLSRPVLLHRALARSSPWRAAACHRSSGASPLFDVPAPATSVTSSSSSEREAIAFFRNLPVAPKKLRVVANSAPGLYWREAMAQLEFNRKNMSVMVKNCIDSAAGNAGKQGLDMDRLVVSAYVPVGPRAPRGRALIRPGLHAQRR